MKRSRFLLAIAPSAALLTLQTACPGSGGKAVAPPFATGAPYVVNIVLVTDYAQLPGTQLRQLLRLHLDVPIADAVTWTTLQTALGKIQSDLRTAYPIVVGLVKGTAAETGRARGMIDAALGPPYPNILGVDIDNVML